MTRRGQRDTGQPRQHGHRRDLRHHRRPGHEQQQRDRYRRDRRAVAGARGPRQLQPGERHHARRQLESRQCSTSLIRVNSNQAIRSRRRRSAIWNGAGNPFGAKQGAACTFANAPVATSAPPTAPCSSRRTADGGQRRRATSGSATTATAADRGRHGPRNSGVAPTRSARRSRRHVRHRRHPHRRCQCRRVPWMSTNERRYDLSRSAARHPGAGFDRHRPDRHPAPEHEHARIDNFTAGRPSHEPTDSAAPIHQPRGSERHEPAERLHAQPARPAQGRRPDRSRDRGRRGGRRPAPAGLDVPAGHGPRRRPAAGPQARRDRRLDLPAAEPVDLLARRSAS